MTSKDWFMYMLPVVLAGLIVGTSLADDAQTPPAPVPKTLVLEGTMKTVYRAANTVIVATMDGVEHAYHFTKDLLIHGGKDAGPDALEGLRPGTTVVVHYTVEAGGPSAIEIDRVDDLGLSITEGVVTRIDRKRKQINIRFDNGSTEVLELTERAAAESADVEITGTKIVVYYRDENGRKLAHFFKRAS